MPKLIINRTSEWANRARKIKVFLDGQYIDSISNGKTKEFNIESGSHVLQTKIDWCGSEKFTINILKNESKTVELSSFEHAKWIMPLATIISFLYLALSYIYNINPYIFLIIILPAGIYYFYHLTFGRMKYLKLKDINTELTQKD